MFQLWLRRIRVVADQEPMGQGLTEYAIVLALIAVVSIVALLFVGTQISSILHTIGATPPFS